jgi:hypothetical protein
MVQRIKGNNSKTNSHHLKDGQDILTSEQAKHFQKPLLQNITTQNFKKLKGNKLNLN